MPLLERIEDPADFVRAAFPFLTEREAEHNLMLGLAGRAVEAPDAYDEPIYEIVVRDGRGAVVAAALRTPPYNLILSATDDPGAIGLIATDAHDRFGELPGVFGPAGVAARFVEIWATHTGARVSHQLAHRVYQADRARVPTGVPGSSRPAGDDDRPLLLAWVDAFLTEALPADARPEDPEEHLARRERDPDAGYVLWEDGGSPVAMAGWAGPTPNGIRIGPVYTPPPHRRRGYASALTAALTERLLAGGRRSCFLFTDLANPTSNAIYQRIGYRPIADMDQYRFEGGGPRLRRCVCGCSVTRSRAGTTPIWPTSTGRSPPAGNARLVRWPHT